MCNVYLVSLIEDFFKRIMIGILREERELVISRRFASLSQSAVGRVRRRELDIEEAIAEGLSFQNAGQLRKNFADLRVGSVIAKFLGEPIARRGSKTKLREEVLQDIFDRRHRLVHEAELDLLFLPADMARYVRLCDRMIQQLYQRITADQKWPHEDPR